MYLTCPVCGGKLKRNESTYTCPLRHSFDIAKQGYVNLYMSSAKGKRHGDDKLMVRARTDFLSRGYYDGFSGEILRLCLKYADENVSIIDAGCGEGKYTFDILYGLRDAGKKPEIIGIDISKFALQQAARRGGGIIFAAASSAKMPVPSGAADIILNIFSPFAGGEFLRALKPGGKVIRAYPLKNHLFELKAEVYAVPYENPCMSLEEEGFAIIDRSELKYRILIEDCGDIRNLFMMTPYYYKTGAEDQKKLSGLQSLDVTLEFGLAVYEKI